MQELNAGESYQKCNQCPYTSSVSRNLKKHVKIHSGDKSNKCNRCDYASSRTGDLRQHLKTHSRKSQTNVATVTMPLLVQAI